MISLLWQIWNIVWLIFIAANGKISKNNLTIWSHWQWRLINLVTDMSTNFLTKILLFKYLLDGQIPNNNNITNLTLYWLQSRTYSPCDRSLALLKSSPVMKTSDWHFLILTDLLSYLICTEQPVGLTALSLSRFPNFPPPQQTKIPLHLVAFRRQTFARSPRRSRRWCGLDHNDPELLKIVFIVRLNAT